MLSLAPCADVWHGIAGKDLAFAWRWQLLGKILAKNWNHNPHSNSFDMGNSDAICLCLESITSCHMKWDGDYSLRMKIRYAWQWLYENRRPWGWYANWRKASYKPPKRTVFLWLKSGRKQTHAAQGRNSRSSRSDPASPTEMIAEMAWQLTKFRRVFGEYSFVFVDGSIPGNL